MYEIKLVAIGRNMVNGKMLVDTDDIDVAMFHASVRCTELSGHPELLIEHNNANEYVVYHGAHYCGSLTITKV